MSDRKEVETCIEGHCAICSGCLLVLKIVFVCGCFYLYFIFLHLDYSISLSGVLPHHEFWKLSIREFAKRRLFSYRCSHPILYLQTRKTTNHKILYFTTNSHILKVTFCI